MKLTEKQTQMFLVICKQCSKEFEVARWKMKKQRFCSRDCERTWTNNHKETKVAAPVEIIIKESKSTLRGDDWGKIRDDVLKRDNYTCQKCGIKENGLGVHHIIPWHKTKDNDANNLVSLCKRCHMAEENNYKKLGVTSYTIKPK